MADFLFNQYKKEAVGDTDILAADTKFILLESTALVEATAQDAATLAAITYTEWSGSATGYLALASNANAFAGMSVVVDNVDNEGVLDANDFVLTAATGAAITGLLLFRADATPTPTTASIPYAHYDITVTPNGGDITLQVNVEGLINLN